MGSWFHKTSQSWQPGKSLSDLAARHASTFRWLKDKLEAVLFTIAPIGYQDEAGFHYGVQPVPLYRFWSTGRSLLE